MFEGNWAAYILCPLGIFLGSALISVATGEEGFIGIGSLLSLVIAAFGPGDAPKPEKPPRTIVVHKPSPPRVIIKEPDILVEKKTIVIEKRLR